MRFARLLTLSFTAAGLIASLWALAGPAAARDDALPLPRFVSLKSAEVNLRTGPGTRYPIEWVYKRRALPVEIIAEFDNWRRVRDWEGTVGWIHRALLSGRRSALVTPPESVFRRALLSSGRRSALVTPPERVFRRAPKTGAPALFRAESGVLVKIISCDGEWCHVVQGETKAWTKQSGLWGVYPGEVID